MGIWVLLAQPIAAFAWAVAAVVLWSLVITRPVREGQSWWVGLALVGVAFAIFLALSVIVYKQTQRKWYSSVTFGTPRFSPVDSPRSRSMARILGCIACIDITFAPDELGYFKKVGRLEAQASKELYRRRFIAKYDEKDWPTFWRKVQDVEYHGVKYVDALKSNLWSFFSLRFGAVRKLIPTFGTIFVGGYVWLNADAVKDGPLRLFQFTALAGFVTAAVIYINFTVSMRKVTVLSADVVENMFRDEMAKAREKDPILAEVGREFADRLPSELREWEGRELFPTVRIRHGYSKSIRNAFLLELFLGHLVNAVVVLVLLGAAWPISSALSAWSQQEVNHWTRVLALGTIAAPFAFCASLVLAFFLLARSRALISLIATGLFLAVAPPLVSYMFGGEVGPYAIMTSVITGLSGIAASAIAELARKRPSAEQPSTQTV